MGRIVNDVIAGNRAVAEKIPGVGSLVSFGAKTAGKAIGKTGEQFGELFGDATAKGAEFAMGRLNKIIIATLKDPSTRAAVLEVFDPYADEKVGRLDQLMSVEDVRRIGGIGQDVVIAAAVSEPVLLLVDALIDGFFTVYGDSPAAEVLDDLDLSQDTLVEYAVGGAPRACSTRSSSPVSSSGSCASNWSRSTPHPRLRRSSAEVVTYQPVNAFDAFAIRVDSLEPRS